MLRKILKLTLLTTLFGFINAFAQVVVSPEPGAPDDASMDQYIEKLQDTIHEDENSAIVGAQEDEEKSAITPKPGPVHFGAPQGPEPPVVEHVEPGPPANPYLAPNPWGDTTENPWATDVHTEVHTAVPAPVPAPAPTNSVPAPAVKPGIPNIYLPSSSTTTNINNSSNGKPINNQQSKMPKNMYQ